MAAMAQTNWLTQALRLVPPPVLRVLDGWSYRLAQKHAAKRRQASMPLPAKYQQKTIRFSLRIVLTM